MPRCASTGGVLRRAAVPLAFLAACGLSSLAAAQPLRQFDAQTLRGTLVVTQPPEVLLNDQPARLAPGARIRGANNLLAMSGEITGQRLLVHYTLDLGGNLLNVWVLTPQEAAKKPWPTTPQQARAWQFNADAQTWSTR